MTSQVRPRTSSADGRPAAVGLDELDHAGHDVGGAVEHRLVGVQRQVGEADEVEVARVARQALRERGRHGGAPGAAGAGDRDEATAVPVGRPERRTGRRPVAVVRAIGGGDLGERLQEVAPARRRPAGPPRRRGPPTPGRSGRRRRR